MLVEFTYNKFDSICQFNQYIYQYWDGHAVKPGDPTQYLPKGLVRVTLAFLKITFGKVFGWKCKEIFCYWTKVSSEEWWSVCFSFVTACISPLRKIFLHEQKQGWCKITNSLWLSWSFLFFPPPCKNMQNSLVKS